MNNEEAGAQKVLTAQCLLCGQTNSDNVLSCQYCHAMLSKQSITAVGLLELRTMGEEGGAIRIPAPQSEGYVLGRTDSKSNYKPDVDLANLQGLDKGVSRRHAAFVRHGGNVHVLDLNSSNGTFLNGHRLTAEVPYMLTNGDQLSLANLHLLVVQIGEE